MSKRKILIVDDEKDFTMMVKLALEQQGEYRVFEENSSRSAVASAVAYKPDLIFLDIIMPGIEGPEVLNRLRTNEATKNIPVVFLTATITKEEVEAQKGVIGGRSFMAKPGSVDELVDCIKRNVECMS